ncbi:BspA family leucine-rich repeat surface protein [Lactobacillus paragasseri]|uniref:mucin-binding protein n=1 Tax=Lactobacillus paragasseri TaxID=2107999 RepID=UPI0029C4C02C|nr:BspA family leucine-rich repeat surface protein [Lactobacillus paragasseri]MDX5068362.1 BspA family leucine-rich repeat surface protein [Lactobacillus paragasseri]MDX5096659.1 BspA family leucine-rich repeat surface protein [Lactobacillus paragasseri]
MNFRDMKRKERWSIRKLTVGAASVLLGTYFVASSQGVAKADTVKDNNVNNNTVNEQTSEKKISQPITPNTQAVVIAKNNHQNSENNTANLQNKADLIRQNNQKIINRLTVQKNTIQKVENSTFSEIKTREAANTQPFNIAENSSKSTTNSNNSLDESTFGKVDVNSWDTETVNNGLNITGYHGSDQEHLVIPNAADFTKAGKLTDENAVITVNAAKFKKILNTVKPITVAISKTDNRKVQVSDKTAFGGNLTTENGVSTNDPNLKQMDLTNLDTSNLTDMSGMFCGAYKVKSLGNLSGWDVSHVTNMQQMFDENTYDSPALESLDGINKWNVSNVQNILCLFRNDTNLKDIDISGWDLSKATGGWTTGQVFASFTNASKTVINLNNVKLPSDFNFATSFANGQVVITNNGDLLQLDTTSKVPFKDNLTFRQYNSWVEYANPTVKTYSHSIFYDSKGSSDAKAIVQDAIDTFLHNNYANYKKITIPTDAVYLSTKPSDSATAIANGTYDIAKTETETSDTTYQVFRDDEIPMQLKYVETDTNKDLGTVTVVGNGITIVTSHSIGLNPLPITNLADWLGNDDYTKSDMSITGQKHFGFDGIAEPVNVEIHLTKKMITEQRTVTIHLYERDSNGDPVKDSNGNYVSVAPDLKATFNYQQDEFVNSKGKVVKKSNIWLWDEKAPKTYDGANSQEVNVGYIEGVQSISNVKCWKVPINKEGTSYILVPNDGNWSTVEFSTPAVDGYYANPFIDNIVNGYPLLGRPANLFVNPRFNNSVRPGTSDASDSSIAYTNQDGIYENKNEHIIWYFPKENTATIKRTINFVKNDASHTQLQETSTQDVNLNGSLVAANPNGTGKDYFTIYPAEYNDASIVTGSPIAVINNSNKPTYSWKAKDGQTSVNTDITGYTVSAVKIGNADYSTNENDIKYAKEIAQNTATLNSPTDLNISFVYAPVSLTSSYQFVDDDNKEQLIAPATSFSGQTGETVELNIKLPDNYELAKGSTLPTSYTFKPSDNEQLKIHLIHQKKVLSDDTRTISRKVTITDPDGKVDPKSMTQSVTFSRSDTLDKVTNQHIYGKWNTKQQALPAIILPVFAGYTPSGEVDAINVTADSNNPADINISYTADKQNSFYKFVDDNENEATVGTSHPISGTTDETIDLTKAIKDSVPTNYDLVPDQNMSYIFKASDNKPLIVHLTHHISAVTNDSNLTKTVSRTINVTKPDGTKLAPVVQRVSFIQTATKDDVTGKVTYNNDWKANGKDSFTEYDAPTVDGYTANPVKIEKLTPDVNTKDSIVNIVYKANPQKISVRFIDDDNQKQQVGSAFIINGVTDGNADFSTVAIPENYVLAEGSKLPTNHKFTANDQTVYTVELRHKTEDAKIDPNAKLSQKVSRTILITNIDGQVNRIVQEHTFTRIGKKDMVTGNINYGSWPENGSYTFAAIPVKNIAGYATSGSAPEIVVTPETMDSIINIGYVANGQTSYYQFIDDDYQTGDPVINQKHPVAGKTDETIKLNISIPENYDLVKGKIVPTSYTFTAENNKPIVIHLVHQISTVTDNPSLTKTIRRTILITNIDGKVDRTVQKHTFTRTGKKDMVTGNISYGPWSENGKYTFAGIPVKEIAGYAINGSAPEVVVTPETKDSTINISYLANGQTSYYQFIDDDYQTGDPVINQKHPVAGKTDETIKLNISIPENYSLIEGSVLPTSYTFESGNKPIIIHLIHQKESLPNDTKTISRKVTIIDPDGKVDSKSTTQSVTFSRNDILDKVTNKHIYGKWNEAQQTLPSIDLPSFNGYTPTGEVTAAEVTTNSGDIADIIISYVPNEQTSYYEFVDDDNHESLIAPATVISGRTGETIKLNIVTPNGYALAKDVTLPRSYRFKATNNEPIIIHLVHHMSKVTNDPKLTKVITRTINVINPDGTTDSIVQTVRFVQTATKDDVTNSGSYMNDWKNVGAESFAEYNVPEIAGYTSSKTKVEKLTPKFGDQNVIVNIDYIKKSQINPVKPVKPIVTPIEKDNKEQSANKQQTVTAEPNSKPKVTQEIKQPVSKPNKTNGKILERKDRQTYKFQGQTVTMKKVVNAKEAGHINKIKAKKAALPQTGNDEAKTTAIIASGLAVDLSLIGLAGLKKKRSN